MSAATVTISCMSDELASPDMSVALDAPQNAPLVSEWLLGMSAVLAYHLGKTDVARMIADVSTAGVLTVSHLGCERSPGPRLPTAPLPP